MPRSVRIAVTVLAGWIAARELHAVGVSWLQVGPEKWLHLVVMAAGAGLCLLRAALRREERTAWILLGLGDRSYRKAMSVEVALAGDDAAELAG